MKLTEINFTSITDVGKMRPNNEDNYYSDGKLFVVADGMGGHLGGELASRIVCQSIKDFVERENKELKGKELLAEAIKYANFCVLKEAVNKELFGMGATVVIGLWEENKFYYAWSGDSRIYLWKKETGLKRLTKDHSLVEDLLEKGLIEEKEAFNHPNKNVVLSAVGIPEERLLIGVGEIEGEKLKEGIILMTTDGLTDMVRDERISTFFREDVSLLKLKNSLVLEALKMGGKDNITVTLIDFRTKLPHLKGIDKEPIVISEKIFWIVMLFVPIIFLLFFPFRRRYLFWLKSQKKLFNKKIWKLIKSFWKKNKK